MCYLTEKMLLNYERKLYVTFRTLFLQELIAIIFLPEQVLPLSQFLLLQTAAPDAIVCLQNTVLEEQETIKEMYFKKLPLRTS